MLHRRPACCGASSPCAGFTLVELVVASASVAVLAFALMSCLLIAGRALDEDHMGGASQLKSARPLESLVGDVREAIRFSERTPNAVTFQVPDRNADGTPETIRYSWSGTPGASLLMQYNGGAPAVVAPDVYSFNLDYRLRTTTGTGFAQGVILTENLCRVLFVSGGILTYPPPGGEPVVVPTVQEQAKIVLIESWGNTVDTIHCTQSQADFDTAVADANVAYVSLEVNEIDLGGKLKFAPVGVVIEKMRSDFGIATSWDDSKLRNLIDIIDNSHYITSTFGVGPRLYVSSLQPTTKINGEFAPDLNTLAEVLNVGSVWKPSLAVIEAGGGLAGGGIAAARRVQLPWGDTGFDIQALTSDGQLIMRRAIQWAAGVADTGAPEIYVEDITMGWYSLGARYHAQAVVWIRTASGGDVEGATVSGAWSGAVTGTSQGVTGADGKILLRSIGVVGGGTFVFVVTDVATDQFSYDPGLNSETSDSITVP